MTNTLQDICDVFSIFHDGTAENWEVDDNTLKVTVSCLYLAELISPDFEYFYVTISGIKSFEFQPWTLEGEIQRSIKTIENFKNCDFEIGSAEIENDHAKISCHEHNSFFNSTGGNFLINADGINVKTHIGKDISLDDLNIICKQYWDNFKRMRE